MALNAVAAATREGVIGGYAPRGWFNVRRHVSHRVYRRVIVCYATLVDSHGTDITLKYSDTLGHIRTTFRTT